MRGAESTWSGWRAPLAAALLLAAAVAVALVLRESASPYTVRAQFASATGAVEGSLVKVAGRKVGTIEKIGITDDGQAEMRLELTDDAVVPLRRGTVAALRAPGLSSGAGKFVDLRIPSGPPRERIPDGGVLTQQETSSSVDVDQFFSIFDERTRAGLRKVIQGNAELSKGASEEANAGWEYLNPSLVATQRLFRELGGDREVLRRFVVDSARLSTDLAARREDITRLVDGLADTFGALASRDEDLTETVEQVPPFMRRANTTFVNLRATIGDLDALLATAKPVTPKLRRTLAELRPFAREARPTLRDLARLTRNPGKDDDLVELYGSFPALRDIAVREAERNGAKRPGSFPTGAAALTNAREPLSFLRPYAVDLTGWFDDFGHSGIYDGFGNASRVATVVSPFATVAGTLFPVPEDLRSQVANQSIQRGQRNRCPGGIERPAADRSNPWRPTPEFNCDMSQVPVG
jgi:phospholipid/cholesterol/gamma-HCH transport system substrate-binding protein